MVEIGSMSKVGRGGRRLVFLVLAIFGLKILKIVACFRLNKRILDESEMMDDGLI
jgi:hypothetical protein